MLWGVMSQEALMGHVWCRPYGSCLRSTYRFAGWLLLDTIATVRRLTGTMPSFIAPPTTQCKEM